MGVVLGFCLLFFLSEPGLAQENPITNPITNKVTNEFGMTFLRILPGSYVMGSPVTERLRDANEEQHPVTITTAFYLQETEVTLAQWRAVMGKKWLSRKKGKATMPVTRVSWYDCVKYIEKINKLTKGKNRLVYRLPTEEEWEYACRAGSETAYAWGEAIDCSKANYGNNEKKDGECILFYKSMDIQPSSPAPVKSFAPNAWGLYDMHGNVWEWCANPYTEYHAGPGTSYPTLESDTRVRRGGSWYKYAQYLRSANRAYAHPGAKFQTTGFRLVIEAN